MTRRKVYVTVNAEHKPDGSCLPKTIRMADEEEFEIDKVLQVRKAASDVGGRGIRYTIRIGRRVVELGGTEFPYQADDGTCTVYSATEIAQIYIAAQTLITTQTAYHNALKSYVNSLKTSEKIAGVTYGQELPTAYNTALQQKLAVAEAQMSAIIAKLSGQ